MDSDRFNTLRICGPMIIQSLEPDGVIDYLFAKGWLTENEITHIKIEKTVQSQCRKLLEFLRCRPSAAFDDFIQALEDEGSFLSYEIRKHLYNIPVRHKREHSVSNIRETLLQGAVPDKPYCYINRSDQVKMLAQRLRALSDHFRLPDNSVNKFSEMNINNNTGGFKEDTFARTDRLPQPPPTNAWLLVHGSAGCGKTVLAASVLRQEPELLLECFPGGVVWLTVGPLSSSNINSQLIQIIDRLENRINILGDSSSDFSMSPDPSSLSPTSRQMIRNSNGSSTSLDEALDNLRRILIRRQQRSSWGYSDGNYLLTSLLLIVLDNVWNAEVPRILSSMPGTFLVTSRDTDVLARVGNPIDKMHVYEDLSDLEVANLLSLWTGYPVNQFVADDSNIGENNMLKSFPSMLYSSPLGVSLLGSLLVNEFYRINDYICESDGMTQKYFDWSRITRPSAYEYDSLDESFEASIAQLPHAYQTCYRRLVIFDPDVTLTTKLCAILWAVAESEAENILTLFTRYSLSIRRWIPKAGTHGYAINGLQLDLLKSSIDSIDQAICHAKLMENYSVYCGSNWLRLVSDWNHTYFWHHATEHLFKSVDFGKLVDLLINLDFLRGRLKVVGATPVIADFRRYRSVFVTLNRLDDWLAYLRFVQTNAYYIIDPLLVQQSDRSRSPFPDMSQSRTDLSPPGYRPDSGQTKSHRQQNNQLYNRHQQLLPKFGTLVTGPKGVDLLQLGLGLSQDNPVFMQAYELLMRRQRAALESTSSGWNEKNGHTSNSVNSNFNDKNYSTQKLKIKANLKSIRKWNYYWIWCNSHIAASQLLWAIPTGSQAVTHLAVETCDASPSSPFHQSPNSGIAFDQSNHYNDPNVQLRKRYLASTSDGRVLLLDANSGYEVAVHQIYSEDVEVSFITFMSNNTECLTCGSNGNLVISTLPPAERIEQLKSNNCSLFDQTEREAFMDNYIDHRGSFDVDTFEDDEVSMNTLLHLNHKRSGDDDETASADRGFRMNSLSRLTKRSGQRRSTQITLGIDSDNRWSMRRSTVASTLIDVPHTKIKVKKPTVLAELPHLVEIVRVDGAQNLPSSITSEDDRQKFKESFSLHCIASTPRVNMIVMGGEGTFDPNIYRADAGPNQDSNDQLHKTKMPNVYNLKRNQGQLRLDCSRELKLPVLNEDYEQLASKSYCKVHLTCISADGSLVAVCMSSGFVWFYSLDLIGWFYCISTKLALSCKSMGNQVDGFVPPVDVFNQTSLFEVPMENAQVEIGPAVSCAIFLPDLVNPNNPNEQLMSFFAASVSTRVLVWHVPQVNYDDDLDESNLAEVNLLCKQSAPCLCLLCPSSSNVLSLDSCVIEGQCILAGGLTSGRVLLWRLRDGCKLLELSVHSSWVTALRLLPLERTVIVDGVLDDESEDEFEMGCGDQLNTSAPIGLLTASADGVIKRWNIGAECLPTPTTPSPTTNVISWPVVSTTTMEKANWDVDSEDRKAKVSIAPAVAATMPTALHGLWTEVFSVWFGNQGSLLVVGCRRHSADLQFLFRQEHDFSNANMSAFQEITMRPSQRYYWHSSKKISSAGQLLDAPSAIPNYKLSVQPAGHSATNASISKRLSLRTSNGPSKHWVLNTGLAGQVYGCITTVSFWSGGRWVAVGFTSGIIMIYSLHFDSSSLFGIVRRYCLFNHNPNQLPPIDADKRNLDGITHLHTWSPSLYVGECDKTLLVVVGVYSSGTVRTWYVRDVCHKFSNLSTTPCTNVAPSECWAKIHQDYRKANHSDESTNSMPNQESNSSNLISWSTCCLFAPSSIGQSSSKILVWLTAGLDGYVYGRELDIGTIDGTSIKNKVKNGLWHLNLAAHNPMSITSADVSPGGQYLITGSTDQTARVWHLLKGLLVFDTGKHPMCVRAVSFRPFPNDLKHTSDGEEIVATGDDGGTLRVWRLSEKMLKNQLDLHGFANGTSNHTARALSPDMHHKHINLLNNLNSYRVPSPDARFMLTKDIQGPLVKRPDFYSTAAGSGSTWLHKLVWSPDGNLLVGVSDRLCVWPFETADSDSRSKQTNFEVYQCRVLRVFSSGVRDVIGSFPPLLVSPSHSTTVSYSNSPCSSRSSSPTDSVCWTNSPIDRLPPTIVTVDSNTGTLYIFDPVGYLSSPSCAID